MKRNYFFIAFIMCIWFVISFITNIIGPIMPDVIRDYQLGYAMAGFLPFSFFLAYGIMSIPAGAMIERYGEKTTMLIAFGMNLFGALIIVLFPYYLSALVSLFTIGLGMAMLQVIINPLMREVGGEENFAFLGVMAQLVFGGASFISPKVYSYLVQQFKHFDSGSPFVVKVLHHFVPENLSWISLYCLFVVILFAMLVAVKLIKLPNVVLKEDEKNGSVETYKELLKNKTVILFFLGIMCYVGTEQGLSNWMSKFLEIYHGYNPEVEGANAVGNFWGLMSIGCVLGLLLLKLLDAKIVLRIFALLSVTCLTFALFGSKEIAIIAFPAMGFFISIIFATIFSLALNSISKHHGSFSGILCSGIFGGALLPLIIGTIGDFVGLRLALMVIYLTLLYIVFISFWAKPLVKNKTVFTKDDLK